MRKLRISQTVLQFAVIGEQQQAFAVLIESSYGIHAFNRDVVPEGPARIRASELADYSVWLIEDDVTIGQLALRAALIYIVSPTFFRQLSPASCLGYSAGELLREHLLKVVSCE